MGSSAEGCTSRNPYAAQIDSTRRPTKRHLAARATAARLAHENRHRGLRVDVELRDSPLDEQLERAARLRARVVAVVGNDDNVELRLLRTSTIETVKVADLTLALRRALR